MKTLVLHQTWYHNPCLKFDFILIPELFSNYYSGMLLSNLDNNARNL